MILTCPSCATRFMVQAQQLGADGRTVRCGRCGHGWHQMPPAEADPPLMLDQEAVQPERVDRAAAPQTDFHVNEDMAPVRDVSPKTPKKEKPVRSGGFGLGWLLLLVLLAAIGAGLWFFRAEVVRYVPQAAQIYQLLGVQTDEVDLGLSISEISSEMRIVDGEVRRVVEGTITNTTSQALEIPPMEGRLTRPDGQEAVTWIFRSDRRVLAPGASDHFETYISDPPSDATSLTVEFVAGAGEMMEEGATQN